MNFWNPYFLCAHVCEKGPGWQWVLDVLAPSRGAAILSLVLMMSSVSHGFSAACLSLSGLAPFHFRLVIPPDATVDNHKQVTSDGPCSYFPHSPVGYVCCVSWTCSILPILSWALLSWTASLISTCEGDWGSVHVAWPCDCLVILFSVLFNNVSPPAPCPALGSLKGTAVGWRVWPLSTITKSKSRCKRGPCLFAVLLLIMKGSPLAHG